MSKFNLKEFLTKTANYEGVQGYAIGQTRAMQLCYRCKQNEGKSPEETRQECWDEFQKEGNKTAWIQKYLADKDNTPKSSTSEGVVKAQVKKPVIEKCAMEEAKQEVNMSIAGGKLPQFKNKFGSLVYFMLKNGYEYEVFDSDTYGRTYKFKKGGETVVWDNANAELVKF